MNNHTQNLFDRTKHLYERIQSRSLGSDDIVSESDVQMPDLRELLERIHKDKAYHRELYSHLVPPLEVFKHFTGDQTVLDVGAHWGYSAVTLRHIGCSANIVSIEAMRANVPALTRLSELDDKFSFFNVAASDVEEAITFYTPVLNGNPITGLSSTGGTLTEFFVYHIIDLATRFYPSTRESGEHDLRILVSQVQARPIDSVLGGELDRLGPGLCSLLAGTWQRIARFVVGEARAPVVAVKMDVEGHEAPALRGLEQLFRKQKPLLMVEAANRDPAVVDTMTSYGYFHAELVERLLVPHPEYSSALDGYWIHHSKAGLYQTLGILKQ